MYKMNNYQLIYKYAEQLHDEGELEYRILSNVAIKLHNFLNSLLSQEKGRSTNKIDVSCPTGRMWESVVDPRGTADIFSKKVEKPYEIFITIRPGLWTKNFLNRAGAKAREALYQFSYLAQQVLKINPYHDELALRLAIYITVIR